MNGFKRVRLTTASAHCSSATAIQ